MAVSNRVITEHSAFFQSLFKRTQKFIDPAAFCYLPGIFLICTMIETRYT